VIGVASIAYVSLPLAIWMLGWLRPVFAVIGVGALLTGVGRLAIQMAKPTAGNDDPRRISWAQAVTICLAVCVFVGLNGVGGFGVQTSDWLKHNAILSDLVNQPWPVAYRTAAGEIALVYYVAYYLPAALVGKLYGWAAANVALFAWTVLGGVLAVLWLAVLSRAPVWLCLLGFVFFSGLDVVGSFFVAPASERWSFWSHNRTLEWWEGHWLFPSNWSLIAYVPQQALGAWLLTGLGIEGLQRRPVDYPYLMLVALALMWSPYAAIGLGLLSLFTAAAGRPGVRQLAARQISIANLAGTVVGGIFAIYFLSRSAPVPLAAAYVSPASAFQRGAFAIGLHQMSLTKFAAHYGCSTLLEFLLLAGVLALVYRKRDRPTERRLLAASTGILLALPFFNHGHYNDLVMRVSIPPLFALLVLSLRALASSPSGAARTSLAALLVVGALHPANMLRLNAREVWRRGALMQLPPVVSLFQLQHEVREYWPYLYQYISPADAFFFKHIARRFVAIDRDPG